MKEIACPCCGLDTRNELLFDIFQETRRYFGEALPVTSGNRCVAHNKKVGGVANSSHLKGLALDFTCKNPTAERLCRLGVCIGMAVAKLSPHYRVGIKMSKKIYHIDVDWSKDKDIVFNY